jgi:hypothetical protein
MRHHADELPHRFTRPQLSLMLARPNVLSPPWFFALAVVYPPHRARVLRMNTEHTSSTFDRPTVWPLPPLFLAHSYWLVLLLTSPLVLILIFSAYRLPEATSLHSGDYTILLQHTLFYRPKAPSNSLKNFPSRPHDIDWPYQTAATLINQLSWNSHGQPPEEDEGTRSCGGIRSGHGCGGYVASWATGVCATSHLDHGVIIDA